MALQINGRTALVTGGGSGICLELTKGLLSQGCNVVVADLSLRAEAEQFVNGKQVQGGGIAEFIKTDVTDWKQLRASFEFAIQKFGSLDIVVPGAGIFEPVSSFGVSWCSFNDVSQTESNFWHLKDSVDSDETSSFKTFDLNISHPVRATQLAIDSFVRQKHGHGVVILISSIAAQMALLPTPMYSASKHAISGFTRCMAYLEPTVNIRVSAVAPAIVKTPIWTEDKLAWVEEGVDEWVTAKKVADTMIDLITNEAHVGGTILEVTVEKVRPVNELNDPGPEGKGTTVAKVGDAFGGVFELIKEQFGK